jgi:WD repeat-containing protein 55
MAAFDETPVPDSIDCAEQIFDLSFHPSGDYLACGLIDGAVELWKYGVGENRKVFSVNPHSGSCRGLQFNHDGTILYTVSADHCFRGIDGSGKELFKFVAHRTAINKLSCLTENTFATGDDAGEVKIWDVRQGGQDPVMEWHVHEDFVSGLAYNNDRNTLLSTSGDATLAAYDLVKGPGKDGTQGVERSDDQEAEMHCLSIIKNGSKIVCGTQDGVMLVFTWGRWGDCSDRYPGHPETIDCMYKIDENSVMTGSSDGLIRAVGIQPNKMIGVLGDHEDFPVEGMQASPDSKFLASFAHDNIVRFNDISMFADDEDDETDEPEATRVEGDAVMAASGSDSEEEGDDDMEESSEFDSGSDSDDDKSQAAGGGGGKGGFRLKTAAEKFYSDM